MKIATRGSDLALWQANWVADRLRRLHGAPVELAIVESRGDREPDRALREVAGIGFFTKEIELAVLDGRADIAVHSHKDLPTESTPDLIVAAVPERAAPNDWLLIRHECADPAAPLWPLRDGAGVGTCSARRAAQLLHRRPDLVIADLRGNVPTRVQHLREGHFDAIVLAQAGLERLGLDLSGIVVVDLLKFGILPAAGQGALAVQCRSDDQTTRDQLIGLHHRPTGLAVEAERNLTARFEGGCSLALGCLAQTTGAGIDLRAAWLKSAGDLRSCAVTAHTPQEAARLGFERLNGP